MSMNSPSANLPSHPQSRRCEIAKLLALGLIRHRQRQRQRSKRPDEGNPLDIAPNIWVDATETTS